MAEKYFRIRLIWFSQYLFLGGAERGAVIPLYWLILVLSRHFGVELLSSMAFYSSVGHFNDTVGAFGEVFIVGYTDDGLAKLFG
jgi:hypothetical protein